MPDGTHEPECEIIYPPERSGLMSDMGHSPKYPIGFLFSRVQVQQQRPCKALLWKTGRFCGAPLWDILVGHSGRKLLWGSLGLFCQRHGTSQMEWQHGPPQTRSTSTFVSCRLVPNKYLIDYFF